MKKIYSLLSFAFLLTNTTLHAQSATSVANGNWTMPTTWDCMCVPITGHSVTINHSVTLNTSMTFTAGGITIGNNGYLKQDASLNRDLWFNGGSFVNNGKADFRYLLLTGGTNYNNGTFTVAAMTNSVSFNNNGTITMDSLYAAANFTNTANGKIIGDSITNGLTSTFLNNGRVNVLGSLNLGTFINNNYHSGYHFTNNNTYTNNDSMVMTASIWNKAKFLNSPSGKVNLAFDFYNYTPGHTAVFDNQGSVMSKSWFNTDTVKGTSTGIFTVSDSSANSGWMKGNFHFCDLSMILTVAPFIDFNSGTISNSITWCTTTGLQQTQAEKQVTAFPNPNNGVFTIQAIKEEQFFIYNALGEFIQTVTLNASNHYQTEINNLRTGIYFIIGKNYKEKIVVTK